MILLLRQLLSLMLTDRKYLPVISVSMTVRLLKQLKQTVLLPRQSQAQQAKRQRSLHLYVMTVQLLRQLQATAMTLLLIVSILQFVQQTVQKLCMKAVQLQEPMKQVHTQALLPRQQRVLLKSRITVTVISLQMKRQLTVIQVLPRLILTEAIQLRWINTEIIFPYSCQD